MDLDVYSATYAITFMLLNLQNKNRHVKIQYLLVPYLIVLQHPPFILSIKTYIILKFQQLI